MNNLEEQNYELNQSLNNAIENNKALKHKLNDFDYLLKESDEKIVNIKLAYEKQMTDIKGYFEKERCNLINSYEETIEKY